MRGVPEGLCLRDAVPADMPLLLRFVRELAEFERLSHELRASEDLLRAALFGAPPRLHALIAERDGLPVGYAAWYYTFNTFAARAGLFVEDVYVVPERRGQGIGRAIFRDLARRAVGQGCGQMTWVVLDWNAPALNLYRSIGARPVNGWTTQLLTGMALASLARG